MPSSQLREKLREEILGIPDSHLKEVYDLVRFFRLGLERNTRPVAPDVMRFAGAWEDMQDFDSFEADLQQRRRAAFRSRRDNEAGSG